MEKSYISEMDLVVSMGRVLNTQPVNLARISILPEVANLVPKEVASNHKVLPVSRLENKLFLAMADPLNVLALDDVKRITKLEVCPMIASEKAIIDKNQQPGHQDGQHGGHHSGCPKSKPSWKPKPRTSSCQRKPSKT